MPEIKMLDHQKIILQHVKHDKVLFEKELMKSIKWLEAEDVRKLQSWLQSGSWESHKEIIRKVFDKIAA
ncbi:MAG: hypothetical protein PVF73_04230 [Bacteroidales bacterium]|jgi:hypothetical protein